MNRIKSARLLSAILFGLILAGNSSWAQAGIEFSVVGPSVKVTKDGKAINKEPQVDDELYISCKFTPTGSGESPYQPVRFQFKVDGQITRDVLAPVTPGKTISMGETWTTNKAGKHLISCEVNPDKAYKEANYADNKKETWVVVVDKVPTVTLGKSQGGQVVATQPQAPSSTPLTTKSSKDAIVAKGKLFLPKPDLTIENIQSELTKYCKSMWPALVIYVTIKNTGSAPISANPDNVVHVKPQSGLIGSGTAIPALGSGQSTTVKVNLRASGEPSGLAGKAHTMNVQIETVKAVEESDYTNNSGKITVQFPANYCN